MSVDVSVITPTFRREALLLESVRSALGQRDVSVECIVLDDSPEGSARQAVESLGDERVRYVKQEIPSKGRPALVRNHGATLAKGRYLYFLDDDDRVADGALASMTQALDASDKGVAFGWVVPFGDDRAILDEKTTYFRRAAQIASATRNSLWIVTNILFRGTLMVNSACMLRASCFAAVGGYDASIPVYEDVEMYMRSIRRFGHLYLDRPVLHYRTGAPSLMQNLQSRQPVIDSYAIMHGKYRDEHGWLEYNFLRMWARTAPPLEPLNDRLRLTDAELSDKKAHIHAYISVTAG